MQVFVSETRTNQEALSYGDVIESSAILRVPPPARNPGAFDWRAWLSRQNIQFTATIRQTDSCVVRLRDRGNPVTALALRLQERFERALHQGLENEPKLAGVLAGMIIGERSEIPPDTYAQFQRTGVFHIFSISGLNVMLVAGVVVVMLRLVRVPRRWSALVAIPALVLFVFATGGRSAAVRSLVMASIWLIGWVLVRPTDLLNSLAAAGLVILAWDPMQLFDGGFVLSFAAVLSLTVLTPPIEKWLSLWPRSDPFLPDAFVPRWQQSLVTPKRWLVRVVASSVAAWIGLLPLMAWYFHLFTPISILANVVVIPLLGVITALGMGAMAAHAVWPWLTLTFNNANFFLLNAMIHTVAWLERVPLGYQFVQAPSLWLVAAYYALGVLFLTRRISWPRRKLTAAIGAPVLATAALIATWPENTVQITVLNLTDGASIFLNTRGERDDWLIDGSGDWSGGREVVPFLRAQGVDRLSTIVLTRGDKAHAAGLCNVVEQVPVGRAIHAGTGSRSKFFWQWLEATRTARVPISTIREGDEVMIGERLHVRVLNPPRGSSFDRSDDNALVLSLELGPTRVLLMSDVGRTVERRLVSSGRDLRATIVIKGRHATETSCTDGFLDAVRPAIVVQSASMHPSTRYPEPELRDRLERRGIRFYRTDETGAVSIRLNKDGYQIRTFFAQP